MQLLAKPKVSEDGSIISSVLSAASSMIGSLGYKKSTTNQIAKKAGVSIGSLYYYFKNKDAVYQKLIDEIISSYLLKLEEKLKGIEEGFKVKEILIDEALEFTFENRSTLRNLFALAPKLERLEEVYDARNRFARGISQRFALNYGEVFLLINTVNGVLDNHIYSSDPEFTKEEMRQLLKRSLC